MNAAAYLRMQVTLVHDYSADTYTFQYQLTHELVEAHVLAKQSSNTEQLQSSNHGLTWTREVSAYGPASDTCAAEYKVSCIIRKPEDYGADSRNRVAITQHNSARQYVCQTWKMPTNPSKFYHKS